MRPNLPALALLALCSLPPHGSLADGPFSETGRIRQIAQAPSGTIWCHDPERDLVSRRSAARCAGKIVDDEQAERIKGRRIERIKRSLQDPPSLFPGRRRSGSGSGTVVSKGGHILTNHHVVAHCAGVSVEAFGRAEIVGDIVAADPAHDLALLLTASDRLPFANFSGSADPIPGDPVALAGFPEHGLVTRQPMLATGHVYVGGTAGRLDRFLLKLAVRPGHSGGPVLDRAGRIVGIAVATLDTPAHYARTGVLLRHIGMAIRNHVAIAFLRQNAVEPALGDARDDLDDRALLQRARAFVVRLGCWR